MGNKVNPVGMRLQVNRTWDSRWFANSKDFGDLLLEDIRIKDFIRKEAKQAGIFELRNIPDEQMQQIIGIACPQIVYPYLRSNVSDIVTRAGFPPVHLAEINFEAFYQQRLQAMAQQQEQQPQGGSGLVMPDGTPAKH